MSYIRTSNTDRSFILMWLCFIDCFRFLDYSKWPTNKTFSRIEQRSVIKFLVAEQCKPSEIHRRMSAVYGNNFHCHSSVRLNDVINWFDHGYGSHLCRPAWPVFVTNTAPAFSEQFNPFVYILLAETCCSIHSRHSSGNFTWFAVQLPEMLLLISVQS